MLWFAEVICEEFMKDKIILKNMKFYGYHGVLPKEQEEGQFFFIDVEMYTDLSAAGRTDDLLDTVDYSKVFEIAREITEKRKFRLIETLAYNISGEILSRFQMLNTVIIRVRKPDAPIPGEFDWAEVEIERSRNEV